MWNEAIERMKPTSAEIEEKRYVTPVERVEQRLDKIEKKLEEILIIVKKEY